MNGQQNQIQIRARDEDLRGVYSNIMQVSHTREEFVLDFFNIIADKGTLVSRVILSPGHLKRMVKVLEDSVKKYEDKIGKIEAAEAPKEELGFKS